MPVVSPLRSGTRALLRRVRAGADRGASAIEMAVIAAVLVVAASIIGAIVFNGVQSKGDDLQTCIDQPVGSQCAGGGGGGGGN